MCGSHTWGSMAAEDAVTERDFRNHDEQKLPSDSM
jgi:hypothetical protein